MLFFDQSTQIYLCNTPVDIRKAIQGLSAIVIDEFIVDPLSGALFVFYNKSRDKLKILWWYRNGFCLFYKKLSKGKFIIPDNAQLDLNDLNYILAGIDISKLKRVPDNYMHII